MSPPNQPELFAHSVPPNGPDRTSTASHVFLGPRTIVSQMSIATAALGEILPITPPYLNASYKIQFYGPTVECKDANLSVAETIDSLVDEQMSTQPDSADGMMNFYFAFVPEFDGPQIRPIVSHRLRQPTNGSNQLWMTFQRYIINSTGAKVLEPRHLECQLYNASFDLNLNFVEGNQNIITNSLQTLNVVDYPKINLTAPSDLMQHAYSEYMWAFTDQIIGSIGIYNNTSFSNSGNTTKFCKITTKIGHTSLRDSSDLESFFNMNYVLYSNSTTYTTINQRNHDTNLTQNNTLDYLIPQLAFNTTLSFMSSDLLSYVATLTILLLSLTGPSTPINTSVVINKYVNLYSYNSTYLLLPYSLAIFFVFIANILGILACRYSSVSQDMAFSSLLSSTRDPSLAKLFHAQVLAELPLPKDISRLKLVLGSMKEGWLGFYKCSVKVSFPGRLTRVAQLIIID